MHLLATRRYDYIDLQTLEQRDASDELFRSSNGSLALHLTSLDGEKTVVQIDDKTALIWLNEAEPKLGYDW